MSQPVPDRTCRVTIERMDSDGYYSVTTREHEDLGDAIGYAVDADGYGRKIGVMARAIEIVMYDEESLADCRERLGFPDPDPLISAAEEYNKRWKEFDEGKSKSA